MSTYLDGWKRRDKIVIAMYFHECFSIFVLIGMFVFSIKGMPALMWLSLTVFILLIFVRVWLDRLKNKRDRNKKEKSSISESISANV